MSWAALWLFLTTPSVAPAEPSPSEPVTPPSEDASEKIEEFQKGVKGLTDDVSGLEHFLFDRNIAQRHCPDIKWDQPSLKKYQEEPKSHLPAECRTKN